MRFYRALLRLYPASFRDEYGGEMAQAFADRLRDAGSAAARLVLVAAAIPDVAVNAGAVHLDILRQDLRYSARSLGRRRGFALAAITVIAIGIGANTAAFSVTDFVLFRPLPFPAADRLVTIWERTERYSRFELSPANYRDWKRSTTVFERVGAHTGVSANLRAGGEPQRVDGAQVSGDFFPTLAVGAALGRTYQSADDFRVLANGADGADTVIVLSDRLWRGMFAANPAIVGSKVVLNDRPFTVIGVMPPSFVFPDQHVQFWIPYAVSPDDFADRGNNYLYAVARLKPGVTVAAARAAVEVAAAQTRARFPKENEGIAATVDTLRDDLSRQSRMMVLALNGAAVCVLLIVCANVANLLVARSLERRLELAVRSAMGAGRERLIRQMATDALVLAAAGGTAGIALAAAAIPLMWSLVPAGMPTRAVPTLDARVLLFAGALTVITAILFGVAPVLRSGARTSADALRDGARTTGAGRERLRAALVTAEIVASVVLLVTAGLLTRALWTVRSTDPGFRTAGVLTLRTALPLPRYAATATRGTFYNGVLDRVRALPGVRGAAYISFLPMVMRGGIWPIALRGQPPGPPDRTTASMRFVTPGFFAALGIPLKRGRDVSETDTSRSEPVAVVSESFVARYFPGDSGLRRTFRLASADRTIVGVVGDIRVRGLERSSEPQVYLPYAQQPDDSFVFYVPKDLVVASDAPLAPLLPAVRAIVHDVDASQPVSDVRTLADIVAGETASREAQMRVLTTFALVAFVLAAVGIHGVVSCAVAQRTAEIGVRIALGAQRADILRMVAAQAAGFIATGVAAGLLLAVAAGRSLQSLLAGVSAFDLPTFAATVSLIAVMAASGVARPALRAIRIDPLRAIRGE